MTLNFSRIMRILGWVFFLNLLVSSDRQKPAYAATLSFENALYSFTFDFPHFPEAKTENLRKFLAAKNLNKTNFSKMMTYLGSQSGRDYLLSDASVKVSAKADHSNQQVHLAFYYAPFFLWEKPTEHAVSMLFLEESMKDLADFAVAALDQHNRGYSTGGGFAEETVTPEEDPLAGKLLRASPCFSSELYPFLESRLKNKSSFTDHSFAALRIKLNQVKDPDSRDEFTTSVRIAEGLIQTLARLENSLVVLKKKSSHSQTETGASDEEETSPEVFKITLPLDIASCSSSAVCKLRQSLNLQINEFEKRALEDERRRQKERVAAAALPKKAASSGRSQTPALANAGTGESHGGRCIAVCEQGSGIDWDLWLVDSGEWRGKEAFKEATQRYIRELEESSGGKRLDPRALEIKEAEFLSSTLHHLRLRLVIAFDTVRSDVDGGGAEEELTRLKYLIAGAQGYLKWTESRATLASNSSSQRNSSQTSSVHPQIDLFATGIERIGQELKTANDLLNPLDQEDPSILATMPEEEFQVFKDQADAQWKSLPREWQKASILRWPVESLLGRGMRNAFFKTLAPSSESSEHPSGGSGGAARTVNVPSVAKALSPIQQATAFLRSGVLVSHDLSAALLAEAYQGSVQESEEFFEVLKEKMGSLRRDVIITPELMKKLSGHVFSKGSSSLLEQWASQQVAGAQTALDAIAKISGALSDRGDSPKSRKWILTYLLVSSHSDFDGSSKKLVKLLNTLREG